MNISHVSHHSILEYTLYNDHLVYPPDNFVPKSYTPVQNIGIFIIEIKNWDDFVEILHELYRYSLIDSFSIQIKISTTITLYLILKIVGIGSNELKFRYYNLKKRILNGFKSSLLCDNKLELAYLSILGISDRNKLKNCVITRENQRFYFFTPTGTKLCHWVNILNVVWMSQQHSRIKILTELLHASDLQCSMIFYSKNGGDRSQSNYYLYATPSNCSIFRDTLNEKLALCNYQSTVRNIFHPHLLGRILTRGPLASKFLQNTNLPPILSADLSIPKKFDVLSSIDDYIPDGVPWEKKKEGVFSLFHDHTILFLIDTLNLRSIRLISENFSPIFQHCILYFQREKDYIVFKNKMEHNKNISKTIILYKKDELRKVIENIKNKEYHSQLTSI